MIGTVRAFDGFSKKEVVNYAHYVCPNCNKKYFALAWGNEDWQCHACGHHIKIKDKDNVDKYFDTAYENKTVLSCAKCGEEIVCYDGNRVCIGAIHLYICYKCNSYVSIKYKNRYLQPKECSNIDLNKDIFNKEEIREIKEFISDMYLHDYETQMNNHSMHL